MDQGRVHVKLAPFFESQRHVAIHEHVRLVDVEVLYTYDPGIVALAKFVKNVRVETPPNLDGPLFANHPP